MNFFSDGYDFSFFSGGESLTQSESGGDEFSFFSGTDVYFLVAAELFSAESQ